MNIMGRGTADEVREAEYESLKCTISIQFQFTCVVQIKPGTLTLAMQMPRRLKQEYYYRIYSPERCQTQPKVATHEATQKPLLYIK